MNELTGVDNPCLAPSLTTATVKASTSSRFRVPRRLQLPSRRFVYSEDDIVPCTEGINGSRAARASGERMREYDVIAVGTGSVMAVVEAMIEANPRIKVAVIDKDETGGICLTRGCIPSKILLYPAELVRKIEEARELGIDTQIKKISFEFVMDRMRKLIYTDIDQIREGLSSSKNIDYYHEPAEFIAPYTIRVRGTEIKSKMIFLCIGSKTIIPQIKGLDKISYHTSDSAFKMKQLPESIAIVGGGYIAAEFGHFFASMGSKVTIIGRNPQFVPEEEPEVSALAKKVLSRHINIITNHEVKEVREISSS